ncbi:thioredoxin family protein [Nonlabens xiamenensis]|uniref:thioredoxin family protein n=1 Tax=Nonlabens xiamenensis TaxID=2341043 RepID=UPI000F610D33|nr:thioredoxin family protein [Nonlabens xiamenensis]
MRILFIFFLFVSFLSTAQEMAVATSATPTQELQEEPHLNWFTSLEDAKKKARSTKKPILVYFTGSDWCTPCKKLEQYFLHTDEFLEQSQNYHLVYLDSPYRDDIIPMKDKKANKKLADQYDVTFPTIIALDHTGKERNRVERFSGDDPRYHWNFMKENKAIFRL